MKTITLVILTAVAAISLAACGYPADNKPTANNANTNANTNAAKPTASAPTKEALVALENKAVEAWKTNNVAFWEGFLADNYVGVDNGKRLNKAESIKMISMKCDIKSAAISDEKMTMVGPDAVVLTTKSTTDGTCEGQKVPSPTTAATLYVRSGTEWKAAYHNEVPIVDPKAAPAKKEEAKKEAAPDAKPAEAKPDALTDALLAVEKKGWDGWKARDAKALGEVIAKDIAFVDIFGTVTTGSEATIKGWTEPKCEIKSAGPSDAVGSSISPTVGILTYKGNAEGTCEGQKLENLWGTTIFVKEGEAWKAAYIFETPA